MLLLSHNHQNLKALNLQAVSCFIGLHLSSAFVFQEFALCTQWSELYAVPDHLRLQLKTEHLLHLLEKTQTDEAFQVLHT